MTAFSDSVLKEDLEATAESLDPSLISGRTFMITGATGLIGSQIAKTILTCNRLKGTDGKVVAVVRNPEKAKKVYSGFLDGNIEIIKSDILEYPEYRGNVDYIIHTASPTGSRYFVEKPVETIEAAVLGTNRILEFAKDKDIDGMVYLSSLEVYGVPNGKNETIKESDYGYIDPLSVRSSYSEGKRMVECLCASYASEYSVPVKVLRLSQTFGAGVEYDDGRVFAEFARCLMEGRDIVLHTDGSTVRTYLYTADAVTAILTVLFKGEKGEAYNATNPETACSIKEMAELIAGLDPERNIRVKIEIPDDLGKYGYNPQMVIRLDAGKLESLGWEPETGLKKMFERTIRSMTERR